MLRAFFCIILCFLCKDAVSLDMISSLASKIFGTSNTTYQERNFELESICFSVTASSNKRMPTKIHLVIVYDHHISNDLLNRTSKQYFKMVNELSNNYSNFLKILEWNMPAKEYISPIIAVTYNKQHLKPVNIIIFSNVGGKQNKLGRYMISENTKHLHIQIRERDLKITESPEGVISSYKRYRGKFKSK